MIREIITPKKKSITVRLPEEMVGKTVELIAFEIERNPKVVDKPKRLRHIENLTKSTLVDLSGFKFDRDQANDYE